MIENKQIYLEQLAFIQKLRAGEESAYELLFKNYYTELIMYANKYLSDFDLSKETVQDLFVNLYEKRHNLDINLSIKSYLYRAIQNRCINRLNSRKTHEKYIDYIKSLPSNEGNKTENEFERNELEIALFEAIDELPPKCRMIFKMNRFEGFSNGEIAERLELSKRTVETQITKALKLLRAKLSPILAHSAVSIFILIGFNLIPF